IIRTMELILNMSEVHTGSYKNNPKQTDIYSEILNRLYVEFLPLAEEKNLKFIMKRNTNVTSSNVDSFAVEQIFKNLIDNAIKFTKEGSVEICINRNDEGNLTASIEDTGIGIAEEYLPNLYSLFSQERQGYTRPYDGSGLGLALSKRFCEMNNVLIEVSSTKGKGTKFILTFPN
ncbi:MAG: ATP-binding protein, partial [Bacteroidota bacterium]